MHIDFLTEVCPIKNRRAVDIGAGNGVYSKQLFNAGATVTAIEIDAEKVSKARTMLPIEVDAKLGSAESLPVSDGSQDLACFFFSLHHVPSDLQDRAFDEVCRALGSGGRLHVVEQFPHGTMFDVVRLVEDETLVRTNSHQTLANLDQRPQFKLLAKKDYVLTREYPTFDFFLGNIVRPDPDRMQEYSEKRDDVEAAYNSALETVAGRSVLHQPCAAYHFEVSS